MVDRPILFSGEMVRALLDGRKTQTRRVIEPQPEPFPFPDGTPAPVSLLHVEGEDCPRITIANVIELTKVRFAVGDRLWVREPWRTAENLDEFSPKEIVKRCLADGFDPAWCQMEYISTGDKTYPYPGCWLGVSTGRYRQSMHMPRAFSRATLEVTDVGVQRVQGITNADALAEGIERDAETGGYWGATGHGLTPGATSRYAHPLVAFSSLWDSLNKKRGFGWDKNPWVVAVGFKVARHNIDAVTS